MTYAIVHMDVDCIDGFLFAATQAELLQKLRCARVGSSLVSGFDVDGLDQVIDEVAWNVERGITPEPGARNLRSYTLLVGE
jgi:hypothetical protein